uniref:Uncharacterized protein n=1 Tax=Arundo donax TaxID=35708 RepID=A0A0A9BSK6_ARUDO
MKLVACLNEVTHLTMQDGDQNKEDWEGTRKTMYTSFIPGC